MKNKPLKVYNYNAQKDWDLEKRANYEINITNIIRHMEMRGKSFTIEYVDENLNVVNTLEFKGDKKKFMEYEAKIEKLVKGSIK